MMTLPDSLTYEVIYDMSRRPPQDWWGPAIPLLIAGVVVRFAHQPNTRWVRVFRRVFVGFAFVMTFIFAVGISTQYFALRSALKRGDVRVLEGTVTDFIPQKPILKHREQFVVVTPTARHKYKYYSAVGTGGMNKSHGHIRNGLRVRVTDRDGVILRLEVARDAHGNTLTPELAERFPEVVFTPEVHVRLGYTADVGQTNGLAVRFIDVPSDTRCPRRASCKEPGDAVAIVELFDSVVGQQPIQLELHANRELYGPFSDGDLVVDMIYLIPVRAVAKQEYIATLMIGRTQRGDD
ncbi:MAG TPA: hypothetical protein VFP10_04080 [Candidatus Eisenbacteria bacterium]|nr:hypothetical protein [Candidatus Eisenbacteria bacterium]